MCTPQEKTSFIQLFNEFKDIFAWTYVIPMKPEAKPFQQKLRKMHPSLEPAVKELNKPLAARIIFLVRHAQWVANLVPVRKKNGDIRLCVDFRNLNKVS